MLVISAGLATAAQTARDYPAALFAAIAPYSSTTANSGGWLLSGPGGKSIQAALVGRNYTFTETRTRRVITAMPEGDGWAIYDGTRRMRRIDRNAVIKTRDGYVPATTH